MGNFGKNSSEAQGKTYGKVLDHSSILFPHGQLLSFGAPAHWVKKRMLAIRNWRKWSKPVRSAPKQLHNHFLSLLSLCQSWKTASSSLLGKVKKKRSFWSQLWFITGPLNHLLKMLFKWCIAQEAGKYTKLCSLYIRHGNREGFQVSRNHSLALIWYF